MSFAGSLAKSLQNSSVIQREYPALQFFVEAIPEGVSFPAVTIQPDLARDKRYGGAKSSDYEGTFALSVVHDPDMIAETEDIAEFLEDQIHEEDFTLEGWKIKLLEIETTNSEVQQDPSISVSRLIFSVIVQRL